MTTLTKILLSSAALSMVVMADTPKPNIVHIMVDDLGWQDIAAHKLDGKPIYDTPSLDRMTELGRRFTQAYSPAPTCAPSRVAFLSGQYPVNNGTIHVTGGSIPRPWRQETNMLPPYYRYGLADEAVTIADVLKEAGYYTGHVAKWHAGGKHAGYPFPLDQGFDFGFTEKDGRHKYYNDEDLWRPSESKLNNFFGSWARMKPDRLSGFASTAEDDPYRLNAKGIPFDKPHDLVLGFIKKHRDKPFFMNYCPYYVHGPIQTRSKPLLEKYLQRMGHEYPESPDPIDKGMDGHTNPYYGAMVEKVDYMIGEVISLLEQTDDPRNPGHKLIENTYVILDSDNGGVLPYTDNSPLQGGKQNTYEGGVRIPFLVLGPNVPAGTVSHTPISLVDLFPTFMQIAGAEVNESLELDGCNIYEHLHGAEQATVQSDGQERKAIFWHFPIDSQMSVGMRKGQWKLVKNYGVRGGGNQTPSLELYQVYDEAGAPKDLSEEVDVSAEFPQVYQELSREMADYLERYKQFRPYRNPNGRGVTDAERATIPEILTLDAVEDRVSVTFQTGENLAKVVEALFIYTLNPVEFDSTRGYREEWFSAECLLTEGKAEALMPPGATHGTFVLRDENNFWIPAEELPAMQDSDHNHNSQLLKNGFAWKPGLHALIKTAEKARQSALAGQVDTTQLDQALTVAREQLEQPQVNADSVRRLRASIRKLEVTESSLRVLNRFPTEPLF